MPPKQTASKTVLCTFAFYQSLYQIKSGDTGIFSTQFLGDKRDEFSHTNMSIILLEGVVKT